MPDKICQDVLENVKGFPTHTSQKRGLLSGEALPLGIP